MQKYRQGRKPRIRARLMGVQLMETLYIGGAVFDGHHYHAQQAVLVRDDTIVEVATPKHFAGYTGARVDTSGMTLMPGLIDCHVHLSAAGDGNMVMALTGSDPAQRTLRALEMAQNSLRGGITSVRDLGGIDFAEIRLRDAIRQGQYLGPDILCAGKVITMTGGHAWWAGMEINNPQEAVRAVRENIKAGADCLKIIATGGVATANVDPMAAHLTFDEVQAAVSEAHRLNRRIAAHAQGQPGIHNAVMAGIDSIEHGFELTDALIEAMLERGTVLVPTLSAIACTLKNASGVPPHIIEKSLLFADMQRDSFRRYVKAGGRVAMGTDAGTPFNFHGDNAQELEHMVAYGMKAQAALQAATANAADLLGLADRGRITIGKRADLLLIKGNPCENIRQVSDRRQHVRILKNGLDVFDLLGQGVSGAPVPRFMRGHSLF